MVINVRCGLPPVCCCKRLCIDLNIYSTCTQYVHVHVYMLILGDEQKEGNIKNHVLQQHFKLLGAPAHLLLHVGVLKLINKRDFGDNCCRSVVLRKEVPWRKTLRQAAQIVINSQRAGEGRDKPPAFSRFLLNKDHLYKYVCIRAFGLQISLLLTPS